MSQFNPGQSTLDLLGSYDSFMESVDSVLDMGCGTGQDLIWWATRALEDDNGDFIPLNIRCVGVDLIDNVPDIRPYKNITYRKSEFETLELHKKEKPYDVIWANNSFQYALDPLGTLKRWRNLLSNGGMLAMVVPSYTEVEYTRLSITQPDYAYHNYTTVSLLHMLAINGFDCAFMKKDPGNSWIKVIAYKTDVEPFDPRTTRWYHLAETDLLPPSACASINRFGYLRQQDLVLEWLDHSLHWFGED
jgi:SAM-dependent methyltransferase